MGIEADIGGVRGAGSDLCTLAAWLRTTHVAWDGATRDGQGACGLPVTGTAFRTLQNAWFTEIGAHATVLEQLCQAIRNSANTDQHQNAARRFDPVTDDGQ